MSTQATDRPKKKRTGFVVAIDGPAGTGKSSVTRRLADVLGFTHVDTGALYRSIAYLLVKSHKGGEMHRHAAEIASEARLEFRRQVRKNPANRIFANGKDVTAFIRTPEVSMLASQISADPEVRAALLGLQREMGSKGKTILEGRDIGTVVFPDAELKFFLTASVEERAKRRLAEIEALGGDAPSFEEVKDQINTRDRADSTRAAAPLKRADDAIEIDTTHLTLDEVVAAMEAIVRKRAGLKK